MQGSNPYPQLKIKKEEEKMKVIRKKNNSHIVFDSRAESEEKQWR